MAGRHLVWLCLSGPGLLEETVGRRHDRSRHYEPSAGSVGGLARSLAFLVSVPCIIFEDEHLLVINKPAGMNTHAPSPFAGEGIYDWLRHRDPRWARLAIIHRLDKETSGVMVFGKSPLANRSLTEQFANRSIRKKYLLWTDRAPKKAELVVKSKIARAGEKYASGAHGEIAETRFKIVAGNA